MRAVVLVSFVVLCLLAAVGIIALVEGKTSSASPTSTAVVGQLQPTQAPAQVQQPPTQAPAQGELPNAPASQAAWIQLVAQSVSGFGAVVNGMKIQDPYGPVQVHFDAPWPLPMGWQAHTGDGNNLVSGQTVPSGMVSSIYPPCSWRAQLQLLGC